MKVLLLTGSPHKDGTSSYLADCYEEGLLEVGHDVTRIDLAGLTIHHCLGCEHCVVNHNQCVFEDDMEQIYPYLLSSDRIALVTPVYYFSVTAQLKNAIDRFYSMDNLLRSDKKELDLLAVCSGKDSWIMKSLLSFYELFSCHFNWDCLEPLTAYGYYNRAEIENSDFGEKAKMKGRGEYCNLLLKKDK